MRRRPLINPLAYIGAAQKLSEADVNGSLLPMYCLLHSILTKQATEGVMKRMTKHLVMLQIVAADTQNRLLYDFCSRLIVKWCAALELADERKQPLDLSTDTQKLLKQAVWYWEKILPQISRGSLLGAMERWFELSTVYGAQEDDTSTSSQCFSA